jgi:hypothetical protein
MSLLVRGAVVMELNKKMLEWDGMESDCNSALESEQMQGKLEKNPIFLLVSMLFPVFSLVCEKDAHARMSCAGREDCAVRCATRGSMRDERGSI